MKHTKQEFEALKYLIKMHGHYPANTMEGMEEQLDNILGAIDPYARTTKPHPCVASEPHPCAPTK